MGFRAFVGILWAATRLGDVDALLSDLQWLVYRGA